MSAITTHVLDTSLGRPAAGVRVSLEVLGARGAWARLAKGETDADGRVRDFLEADAPMAVGRYRLVFDTAAYFVAHGVEIFYPSVEITFEVSDVSQHYHVPLLLSPFGYTTYRGS